MVINDWAKILDNEGQVDTFILDFEEAFDTPPHQLLKSKLFGCGIGGKTRSKFGLGPGFVWCPTGHCPWSLFIFFDH